MIPNTEVSGVKPPVAVDANAEAARKRGPGRPGAPAEPPPFKWKLVGESAGISVTLIKSIEREEVEAQLLRLQQEGYYRKLLVVPIEEPPPAPVPKIEKPPEPPKPKAPPPKKAIKKPSPAPKAVAKSVKKAAPKKKK
ncbi:MAG TPA: hypothetical protein VGM03_24170 [Phycisphaerae bacterium]